jgi:hypothetical protein
MRGIRGAVMALVWAGCGGTLSAPETLEAVPVNVTTEPAPEPADEAPPIEKRRAEEGRSAGAAVPAAKPVAGEVPREELAPMGYLTDADHDGGPHRAAAMLDVPSAPALKAGSTDDNADFGGFLSFLGRWTDRARMSSRYQRVNVRGRGIVSVSDTDGQPVSDAEVRLVAAGEVLHVARTFGDGITQVFPHLATSTLGEVTLEIRRGDTVVRRPYTVGADLDVTLPVQLPHDAAVPVDVAIVLDTTGSMSDELSRIKATLARTVSKLEGLERPVDLRVGAVYYRDRGDDYVTQVVPLTPEIGAFERRLRRVQAGGGGDGPESLNQGLAEGVHDLDWRPHAAKVGFLIADARPHMDYANDVPYGTTALDALEQGVRVHTVAASGLDEVGSLVFRQVAQITRGEFIFIEYGGDPAASARAHGVGNAEQLASNNLDDILFERVRAEVDAWRR